MVWCGFAGFCFKSCLKFSTCSNADCSIVIFQCKEEKIEGENEQYAIDSGTEEDVKKVEIKVKIWAMWPQV